MDTPQLCPPREEFAHSAAKALAIVPPCTSLCDKCFSIPLSARTDVGDSRRHKMRLAMGVSPMLSPGRQPEIVMSDAPPPAPKHGGQMVSRSTALGDSQVGPGRGSTGEELRLEVNKRL